MRPSRSGSLGLVGAFAAVIAVGCCARLPTVAAVLGGLSVVALIGVASGLSVVAAGFAALVFLSRARRADLCSSPTEKAAP